MKGQGGIEAFRLKRQAADVGQQKASIRPGLAGQKQGLPGDVNGYDPPEWGHYRECLAVSTAHLQHQRAIRKGGQILDRSAPDPAPSGIVPIPGLEMIYERGQSILIFHNICS